MHIEDKDNTIVTRATITIATMAKTPAHQRQCYHHNEGDDASFTMSNKGNNASLTTAETSVHQQRQ